LAFFSKFYLFSHNLYYHFMKKCAFKRCWYHLQYSFSSGNIQSFLKNDCNQLMGLFLWLSLTLKFKLFKRKNGENKKGFSLFHYRKECWKIISCGGIIIVILFFLKFILLCCCFLFFIMIVKSIIERFEENLLKLIFYLSVSSQVEV
jgi:hypothetical protein